MQAVVMRGFGTPAKARFAEVPMPVCDANHLLISVTAAGVNPADWKECEGHLEPFYGRYSPEWVPGYDAAGIVYAVGDKTQGFSVGDRVVAFSDRRQSGHNGTFAEYVRVLPNAVSLVPASVKLIESAAMPTAGLTGYQALFRSHKGNLHRGDSVLIHGASGGVGSYAVQFAKAAGLLVAATCSAKNVAYVRSLGADFVMDYAKGGVITEVRRWQPKGVHALMDCAGPTTLPDSLDALRIGGRLLNILTVTEDGDVEADSRRASQRGYEKVLSMIDFDQVNTDMDDMLKAVAKGTVKTPPLTIYPLADGANALQHMRQGGVRGKIVIKMKDERRAEVA